MSTQTADLLCSGYTRAHCIIHVPIEIIEMIILFYCYKLVFNQHNYGPELTFPNDSTVTIQNRYKGWEWHTALFGSLITSDMCSIFEISFLWKVIAPRTRAPSIAFGFVSSMDITDWNLRLGHPFSKYDFICVALETNLWNLQRYSIRCHIPNNTNDFLGNKLCYTSSFNNGNVFKLKFDFVNERACFHS